jgi:hypothetical protein
MRVARPSNTLLRVSIGVAMSLFGFIIARIHLHVFDKIFLRQGNLERFNRQK